MRRMAAPQHSAQQLCASGRQVHVVWQNGFAANDLSLVFISLRPLIRLRDEYSSGDLEWKVELWWQSDQSV